MEKTDKNVYLRLSRVGCILCRQIDVRNLDDSGVEMHHIRRYGQTRGSSKVIPLCAVHHRLGDTSVHSLGHKGFEKYWGFSEEDLLERLNDHLQKAS